MSYSEAVGYHRRTKFVIVLNSIKAAMIQFNCLLFAMDTSSTLSPRSFHGSPYPEEDMSSMYLSNAPLLQLNNGAKLSCFLADAGSIIIFGISVSDVQILNKVFQRALRKFGVNMGTNHPVELDSGESFFFFYLDDQAMFWNELGHFLSYPPDEGFYAIVTVKLSGIRFSIENDQFFCKTHHSCT